MTVAVPSETLHSESIVLRQWRPEDADWYISARDDEVFRWTTETPDASAAMVRDAIERNSANPTYVGLAICDRATGDLLGNIALKPTGLRRAEVMYWLAPSGRGRGAATEAVRLLTAWAFKTSALTTVELYTKPGNASSQNVATRAGFRREGTAADGQPRFVLDNPGS